MSYPQHVANTGSNASNVLNAGLTYLNLNNSSANRNRNYGTHLSPSYIK